MSYFVRKVASAESHSVWYSWRFSNIMSSCVQKKRLNNFIRHFIFSTIYIMAPVFFNLYDISNIPAVK